MKNMSIIAASLLLTTAPAQAAPYLATVTGTYGGGYDENHLFFASDPANPGDYIPSGEFIAQFFIDGINTADGFISQTNSASLTINDKTVTIAKSITPNNELNAVPFAGFGVYRAKGLFRAAMSDQNTESSSSIFISIDICCRVKKSDAQSAPFIFDPVSNFSVNDIKTGSIFYRAGLFTSIADMSATKFNIVPLLSVTAVPEPSTWLLMIGGFGLIGARLRNRRRFYPSDTVGTALTSA